jgi:site-specific DNA-methyltransferase (adenine-specific)
MDLTNEWKGSEIGDHPFHSMCSYMAMFPPGIPRYFVEHLTDPGDVVLDPFSGRGTTPLEACLQGRVGVGNDLNPMAHVLTKAKVDPPGLEDTLRRVSQLEDLYPQPPQEPLEEYRRLEKEWEKDPRQETRQRMLDASRFLRGAYSGDTTLKLPYYQDEGYYHASGPSGYTKKHHHPIWIFFHPETLRQLAYLKGALGHSREDCFLRAVTLGIMHGHRRPYLSLPMPNTFSMSPRYVLKYCEERHLVLPLRDVFQCLRQRLERLFEGHPLAARGYSVQGDARRLGENLDATLNSLGRRVRLVVTSPPYLKVIKYGLYNWIRLWFLDDTTSDCNRRLDQMVDSLLDDGHRLEEYLVFMRETMESVRRVLAKGGMAAFVIGDVEKAGSRIVLAEHVWEECARPAGFEKACTIVDSVSDGKKVTKIWGSTRGRATRVDRVLVLRNPVTG